MKDWKVGSAMRFFMLVVGGMIWLGIFLTGFATAHWVLYLPACFLTLAAITGICPGMFFSRKLFEKKSSQ